jgi:LmbE family N-acetylglucosaminyl deacetylase
MPTPEETTRRDVVVERAAAGRPHRGKVMAVVFPHADDFPIFAGGTIAKLLSEGYTGYMIRSTNDEKDSLRCSIGETIRRNEKETREIAAALGIQKVYDLNYRNHYLDTVPASELRHRLILLFRFLKVDTVISFDPWGHYEENPDHTVTGQAVEAACWMAGGRLDLPELLDLGISPKAVTERYYVARGPSLINRVVDIGGQIEIKRQATLRARTQIENMKASMGRQGMAIARFVDASFIRAAAEVGQPYGLSYAEQFHYVGPGMPIGAGRTLP